MEKKIRINIASSHRFHLLDLSRELSKQGYDVMFYSYVSSGRCEKFGLERSKCSSFLWLVAPFFLLSRILGRKDFIEKYRNLVMDYYMSWFMRPCDIYIALGTVYKKSFLSAKKRFGAKTILEWGSMHTDDQLKILDECGVKRRDPYFNKRAKEGYEIADYIAIPADHTRNSFLAHGIPEKKLLQNPYGVDVSMFHPIKQEKKYDVIMVGGWSRRKGADLIIDVIKETGLRFLHVGAIGDMPFPSEANFTHVDPVDQSQLPLYYNLAKVFLLPSREEGLAMVQVQAVACNLPIVGSVNSGAVDLKRMVKEPKYINIIKDWTKDSVAESLNNAIRSYYMLGNDLYAGDIAKKMCWDQYGVRYYQNIQQIVGKYE